MRLRGSVSSQYLTALLMAAPLAEGGSGGSVEIVISDELVSQPYVAMTVGLMARFGVEVGALLCMRAGPYTASWAVTAWP